MGLITSLLGYPDEVRVAVPRKVSLEGIAFISEEEAIVCCVKQLGLLPRVLEFLQASGVSEKGSAPLSFTYHTNTRTKAASLAEYLKSLGYLSHHQVAETDSTLFLVTGTSESIRLDKESLKSWTESMCDLGYKFDAEMQHWDTCKP